MNITMLLYNPFITDARVYNEARSLIAAGHDVTLIAFDREHKYAREEIKDGIRVVRVRGCCKPKTGFGWPVWNGLIMVLWQWQAYRAAMQLDRAKKIQALHAHDLDTMPAAILLKKRLKLPLVFDAHEIFSYIMEGSFPGWVASAISRVEKALVKQADYIVTVSEPLRLYYASFYRRQITIVMNCKEVPSIVYGGPGKMGELNVLYVGLLDATRAIMPLISAVHGVKGVKVTIGGIGKPDFVRAVEAAVLEEANVEFVGRVPMHDVVPLTLRADVVFCMFDPRDAISRVGLPNKLFEAMACGRPIICTSGTYSGEMAEREGVGLAVDYNDDALREAINLLNSDAALRERLGRNGLKAAVDKYNWSKQVEKLLAIYSGITSMAIDR